MARIMLIEKKLPLEFWGKVGNTAAYILNRCPTKKLKNQVSEEVWSGRKPYVSHLKVFSSICYKHIPDARRKKLEDKNEAMILVGYHNTRAYRLLDPQSKKIAISRYVKVLEDEYWDCTANKCSVSEKQVIIEDNRESDELTINEVANEEEILDEESTTIARPQRNRQIPRSLEDCQVTGDEEVGSDGELVHFTMRADIEPLDYIAALCDKALKEAMIDELKSIEKSQTCELIKLRDGKKAIDIKLVFKLKFNQEGKIVKHKARLLARGLFRRKVLITLKFSHSCKT